MNLGSRVRELLGERDLLSTVLALAGVIGIGVLAGYQYMMPDKRVLGAAAAVVLLGVAWRLDVVTAVGVLILALPFPRYTTFGSTSVAFVLLLAIMWLLRYTQREAAPPRRTALDAPLALLILAYILSFYNVDNPVHVGKGLINTVTFLATVILFYLITSNVRTEADLRRVHLFQTASIGAIYVFCFWELAFPGSTLVSGWIDLRSAQTDLAAINRAVRIGGPWFDYELLSEFAALNVVFFIFMISQARSASRRVVFTLFLLASIAVQFATVTRGGTVAMLVGLAYLMFLVRRRLSIVPMTILGVVAVLAVAGISVGLREYTTAGDIFGRFGETRFINGMPDSRAPVWPQVWGRWMQHPLLGNGPFYSAEHGLTLWYWPHNLPLFLGNCFGFFGLGAFVWMFVRLWKATRPTTDRLGDPNYAAAYLLAVRAQLVIFVVDEMKIEYLRNPNYQYQVWVLFSMAIAGAHVLARSAATAPVSAPAPTPPPRLAAAHSARP